MARKFGPFDSPPTQFYEVENRRMQRAFNPATGFVKSGQGAVTAGTGAQLVIAAYPDGALIDGLYVENPATETVTLTTNSGNTNPRIDRLVMRLDMTAKTIAPVQIVGTPAASPAVPPLVRTSTVFDMPLCRYTMPGSASAQNPGSIIDERGWIADDGRLWVADNPTRDINFPTPTAGDACVVAGTPELHDGTAWRFTLHGVVSRATDANGLVTITHNAGQGPQSVQLTPVNSGDAVDQRLKLVVHSVIDANTIQARAVRTDTSEFWSNTLITFYWTAKF